MHRRTVYKSGSSKLEKVVGFLAVIADEAKSSKTEQLSVCIRYTDGLQIKERFICFVDCSNSRDAAGIVSGIKVHCSRVV